MVWSKEEQGGFPPHIHTTETNTHTTHTHSHTTYMHAHTQHTHARTYDTLAFHHPQSQQDGRNFFTLVALSQGCYEPSIPLYSGQQYQSQSEIYDFSNQKSFPGWQFVIWIYLAIARHGNLRSKSCLAPPSEIHQRLSRFTLRFARCTLEAS